MDSKDTVRSTALQSQTEKLGERFGTPPLAKRTFTTLPRYASKPLEKSFPMKGFPQATSKEIVLGLRCDRSFLSF